MRHKQKHPKKATRRPPEYQKQIREAQDRKLQSLGVSRAHPFISKDLFEFVRFMAGSIDLSRPVVVGAIVSAFLKKDQYVQLSILESLRRDAIDRSQPILPKAGKSEGSKASRHSERQKLKGKARKMIYLKDADLSLLNTLRADSDYESQGNLVDAILKDFFEEEQDQSRPSIIKKHALSID
jgi:hypothetical protein